jgi:hypothetical protein
MSVCRGCGSPLSKRSQKVYCSNRCQIAPRRAARTRTWLDSGEAIRVGTQRGHFIRGYLSDAQSGCCAICGGATEWLGCPSPSSWTTSTVTPRTTGGTICGWSARTATLSSRRTSAATAARAGTYGASDTPTGSRTDAPEPGRGAAEHHHARRRGRALRRRGRRTAHAGVVSQRAGHRPAGHVAPNHVGTKRSSHR